MTLRRLLALALTLMAMLLLSFGSSVAQDDEEAGTDGDAVSPTEVATAELVATSTQTPSPTSVPTPTVSRPTGVVCISYDTSGTCVATADTTTGAGAPAPVAVRVTSVGPIDYRDELSGQFILTMDCFHRARSEPATVRPDLVGRQSLVFSGFTGPLACAVEAILAPNANLRPLNCVETLEWMRLPAEAQVRVIRAAGQSSTSYQPGQRPVCKDGPPAFTGATEYQDIPTGRILRTRDPCEHNGGEALVYDRGDLPRVLFPHGQVCLVRP